MEHNVRVIQRGWRRRIIQPHPNQCILHHLHRVNELEDDHWKRADVLVRSCADERTADEVDVNKRRQIDIWKMMHAMMFYDIEKSRGWRLLVDIEVFRRTGEIFNSCDLTLTLVQSILAPNGYCKSIQCMCNEAPVNGTDQLDKNTRCGVSRNCSPYLSMNNQYEIGTWHTLCKQWL